MVAFVYSVDTVTVGSGVLIARTMSDKLADTVVLHCGYDDAIADTVMYTITDTIPGTMPSSRYDARNDA